MPVRFKGRVGRFGIYQTGAMRYEVRDQESGEAVEILPNLNAAYKAAERHNGGIR